MEDKSELEKLIDRQMADLERDREDAAKEQHKKRNLVITIFSVVIAVSMLIRMFM
ncbi:MAG: hypothetical protein PUE63_07260 [Lachnospiraceae bacterium]|nr:hypothetical protein [Lachnospiraceae bacterium]